MGPVIEHLGELDGFGHRHLGRRGHDHRTAHHTVLQDVEDPIDLATHHADANHFTDGIRRRELAYHVAQADESTTTKS